VSGLAFRKEDFLQEKERKDNDKKKHRYRGIYMAMVDLKS
jgi:hypothetical protein